MSDKSVLIAALSRYIALLSQEEKRLKWVTASTGATDVDAAAKLKVISEKLTSAERKLSDLELGPKRKA